jgi:hypothetical protein
MKILANIFIVTVSTDNLKLSAAYAARVPIMKGSGILLWAVIATVPA